MFSVYLCNQKNTKLNKLFNDHELRNYGKFALKKYLPIISFSHITKPNYIHNLFQPLYYAFFVSKGPTTKRNEVNHL